MSYFTAEDQAIEKSRVGVRSAAALVYHRAASNEWWQFIKRENNRLFDKIPIAQVIKERVDHVLKYPDAGNGIFAVY